MKKIIFLMFNVIILLLMISVKPSAYTVTNLPDEYYEINLGNDEYLIEENLEITSGVVNWNKEGIYYIKYIDRSKNNYSKKVTILSSDNKQCIVNNNDGVPINYDQNNQIIDCFYINEHSFYLISNYQLEDPTYYDQEKISIDYYENYEYKWTYRYYKFSRFVDGIMKGDNLIITGEVYNSEGNNIKSICLFEITKNREIIKNREIACSENCFSHGVYVEEEFVYLFTNTKGNDLDYENIKEDLINKIVLLKIDYKTFKIIDGVVNNNITNFLVNDSSFYDGRLCVSINLKQNIIVDNVEYTNIICEYNRNLQLVNMYYFNCMNKKYIGHQVLGNDICYYCIDYEVNENCVEIQYLNKYVDEKNILLDLQNGYDINNIKIINVDGNDLYISLLNNKGYYLGYGRVSSTYGVEYLYTQEEKINILCSKITNSGILNTYFDDQNLMIKKYNIIDINTVTMENNLSISTKKTVRENFGFLSKTIIINNTNVDKFGTYTNICMFKNNIGCKYYFYEYDTVKLQTNIDLQTIYQTGKEIKFNGIGYLNGMLIESGYVVEDIGNYQLEIIGNNDTKILNFTISDLTANPIERSNNYLSVRNIDVYKQNIKNNQLLNYSCQFENFDNNKNIVFISMCVITFGVLCFVLVRKKI